MFAGERVAGQRQPQVVIERYQPALVAPQDVVGSSRRDLVGGAPGLGGILAPTCRLFSSKRLQWLDPQGVELDDTVLLLADDGTGGRLWWSTE